MGRPFTDTDIQMIELNYESVSHADLGIILGRTEASIRNYCYKRGLRKRAEYWADEDIETLSQYYRNNEIVDLDYLSEYFGRMKSNISRKAREMGLTSRFRPHTEEAKENMSKIRKEWFETNEHPRGFLGGKHTDEFKQWQSRRSKEWQESLTEEERSRIGQKAAETRIERYGTASPFIHQTNPYSRTKSGKRADLGGQFFRSSWEANYARYLDWLTINADVTSWEYEPDTFVFEEIKKGTRSYTPDFKVYFDDERYEYHEVKGWMDNKSKTRLKLMAKYYPNEPLILIDAKVYRGIEKSTSGLISNWESSKSTHTATTTSIIHASRWS